MSNIIRYDFNKIYVCHGQSYSDIIPFMYKPFLDNVRKLLEPVNYKTEYNNNINYDLLQPNELLLFMGDVDKPDPFVLLTLLQKGIYVIYYNTEPKIYLFPCNEIWTYSKYLFTMYNKINETQIIQYVPIMLETSVPYVPYHIYQHEVKRIKPLTFIGSFNYRAHSRDILFQSDFLRENIEEVYNLWNEVDFNRFISKEPKIYLNVMKIGESEMNVLPSARINKLLSHKCIIISEHCNEIDDELYKNMIYFCKLEEIEDVYRMLLNKSNEELQKHANEIYKLFCERFCEENVKKSIIWK